MSKYENPAAQFFRDLEANPEAEADTAEATQTRDIPEGYKLDPRFIETKSKKLQLLMQPSLYKAVKSLAKKNKSSINNYIHTLLKAHVEEMNKDE